MTGPELAVQTCGRRLAALGARPETSTGATGVVTWPDGAGADRPVSCEISWWGSARPPDQAGSEALVQAATGLMHLHGRDHGGPRRIGVEVASVAAGMFAAQAMLAMAIGGRRGRSTSTVHTSVLQAGLLQASHYLAAATCPQDWWPAPNPAPGPPFATADGRWFEIETFDPDAWKAFWLRLGAPEAEIGRAWTQFRPRYYRGTSSTPVGFHEATAAVTLEAVTGVASECGVSLSLVRDYDEVLAEGAPSGGHPLVDALLPPGDGAGGPPAVEPIADGGPGDDLPLAGLRVVEATSRLQGPLAGLLLQMLGAHVTRVESPGGDVGRGVPPLAGDTGSFFLCFNRAKHTIEVDLATPAGRAELAELASSADAFLHNWRPGKAAEWGLSASDLSSGNPGLVYTEAAGWEPGSSASGVIGTDFLVQAHTGLGYGINPENEPPFPSRVLLTDFLGALVTCEGVLSGLYRQALDGRGTRVRTSLQSGAMALQAHVLDGVVDGGDPGRRRGRPVWGALDVPVATSDGFIVVDAGDRETQRRLGELYELDLDGPGAPLDVRVAGRIGDESSEAVVRLLTEAGIACAAVTTELAALATDPAVAAMFETLAASCRAPSTPWAFTA